MSPRITATVAVLSLITAAGAAFGQCGALKLTAQTPLDNERVGGPMAFASVSGTGYLVTGSPTSQYGGFFSAGNVKVFAKISNAWGELGEINFPGQAYDGIRFGSSVDYKGAQIIVGAPGVQTDRGSAYIFQGAGAGTWNLVATIGNSQSGQRVGEGVAIDGDYAFVGAPGHDTANNTNSGLVSIQKRNANGTWSQVQTLSDAPFGGFASNREMGAALAAANGLLVIGCPSDTETGWPAFHGSVRVMRRDAAGVYQIESDGFSPGPRQASANFGAAVATDGTRIAVAAPHYSTVQNADGSAVTDCGSVVIMEKVAGAWTTTGRVFAPQPTTLGNFGAAIAINGDRLLVAESGTKKAYAYRLVNGAWGLERSYSDEDSAAAGAFGSGVALSDQNVFIGDTGDDHTTKADAGAVYIKALPAGWADTCQAAPDVASGTVTGCLLEATADGLGSACLNRTALQVGRSAWVAWTPSCSGNVIVDTIGSDFDTMLSIHTACPTAAAEATVACDDDGWATNGASLTSFNYTAGTRYSIRVAGYTSSAGNFTLRINEWQTPANDTCAAAQALTLGSTAFKNCKATVSGPAESSCSGNTFLANDVWFKYTAPTATGQLTVSTCGSDFDTMLIAYNGPVCPTTSNTSIACNDDGFQNGCQSNNSRVSLTTTPNQQLLLRVGGYSGSSPTGDGLLTLSFTPSCPADFNLDSVRNVADIFAFLSAWFNNDPRADFDNQDGKTVADIFAFLSAWFAGC
ncbi:MAG: FG-GAP repeat protein [Phycisphaerales bacterium]|nr:FG-GAP repeat protein [Phycisphaerales bacterium]